MLAADVCIAITILFLSLPGPYLCLIGSVGLLPEAMLIYWAFTSEWWARKQDLRPKCNICLLSVSGTVCEGACVPAWVWVWFCLGAGCGGRRAGIITPHRISCEVHILISLWTRVTPRKRIPCLSVDPNQAPLVLHSVPGHGVGFLEVPFVSPGHSFIYILVRLSTPTLIVKCLSLFLVSCCLGVGKRSWEVFRSNIALLDVLLSKTIDLRMRTMGEVSH